MKVEERERKDLDEGALLSPDVEFFAPQIILKQGRFSTVTLLQMKEPQHYYTGHLWHPPNVRARDTWSASLDSFVEALRRIDHPGVRRFSDVQIGTAGAWLLFEFVPGYPADQLGKLSAQIDPRWIIGWLFSLLEAAHYLHTQTPSIVLGCIDPASIILGPQGPVLVDLQFLERSFPESMVMRTSPEKARFMAPEARSSVLRDPRQDVFGLAACAFWLLTGEPPEINTQADSEAIVPRMQAAQPSLPTGLCVALAGMLSFHPSRRPATALDASLRIKRWVYPDADRPPLPEALHLAGPANLPWLPAEARIKLAPPPPKAAREVAPLTDAPLSPPSQPGLDQPAASRPAHSGKHPMLEHIEDAWWALFSGDEGRAARTTAGVLVLLILLFYGTALREPPQTAAAAAAYLQVVAGTTEVQHVMGDRHWQLARSLDDDNTVLRSTPSSSHTRVTFGQGSTLGMAERSALVLSSHEGGILKVLPLQGRFLFRLSAADNAFLYLPGASVTCPNQSTLEINLTHSADGGRLWLLSARQGAIQVQTLDATLNLGEGQSMQIPTDGTKPENVPLPAVDEWVTWNLQ